MSCCLALKDLQLCEVQRGQLQLNQKVKSTTYVNSSGLQVRKTTASNQGNPELRSQTFALKLSKDLA